MLLIICYRRIESRRNKKDPQRIIKTKPFMNKFSIRKRWLEKFEKNNPTIALNVLYAKKEKIYPPYVSKHKSNREKQVFLLMIPKREGWHLTVKKLSSLLRRITSKYHGDFYCLNWFHSFLQEKTNVDPIKKYMKIKIFVTV